MDDRDARSAHRRDPPLTNESEDRPHVALVIDSGDVNGVSVWARDLAIGLQEIGWDVTIVVWSTGGSITESLPDQIETVVAGAKSGHDIRAAWRVVRYVKQRATVVHLAKQPIALCYLLRLMGVTFGASLHVDWMGLRANVVGRSVFWTFHDVILVSVTQERRMGAVLPRRVVRSVVPNPVCDPGYVRVLPGGNKTLLVLSRLVPDKGLERLPRVVALLVDMGIEARILVVGDGPLRCELEAATSAAQGGGGGERVRFVGTNADLDWVFQEADALLSLSERETFGRTLVEAARRGVVSVAPRTGVAREVLGPAPAYYFDDEKELVGAVAACVQRDQDAWIDDARRLHEWSEAYAPVTIAQKVAQFWSRADASHEGQSES